MLPTAQRMGCSRVKKRFKLRIGINALFQASGGSLSYLAQLLNGWEKSDQFKLHQFILYSSEATFSRLDRGLLKRVEVRVLRQADRGLLARLVIEQAYLAHRVVQDGLDVLFCPANIMPYVTRIPCVVVFRNAAPFCDSIAQQGHRSRFAVLGLFMRMSAQRAARVIFISRYFHELFVGRYNFPRERGTVIYNAYPQMVLDGRRQVFSSLGLRRPFILSVAHLYPFRNIIQLIEGFARAQQQGMIQGMQLAIVGGDYDLDYYASIRTLIEKLALHDDVKLVGQIPHQDIFQLISECELFAFSSTCENCPTTLIEALSVGAVIACSNLGVMPEIAGQAALYFDPYRPDEIGRVLGTLMNDPGLRRRLSAAALAQAKTFPSGAEVARLTLAVLEQAAGRRNNKSVH